MSIIKGVSVYKPRDVFVVIYELWISDAGNGGLGGLACQYLPAQLTLFQPGEGRLSPPITTDPKNLIIKIPV